jgi:segregation and condensation protein B
MERDLVRISGRADELGRPLMYGTTRRFLQTFGLRHLDELPQAEVLRRPHETQTGTEIKPGNSLAIKTSPLSNSIDQEDAT